MFFQLGAYIRFLEEGYVIYYITYKSKGLKDLKF